MRKALDLGMLHYSRGDLEAALERGEALRVNVQALPASQATSRLNWPARRSPRLRSWVHCTPAPRSEQPWQIAQVNHRRGARQALADTPLTRPAQPRRELRPGSCVPTDGSRSQFRNGDACLGSQH